MGLKQETLIPFFQFLPYPFCYFLTVMYLLYEMLLTFIIYEYGFLNSTVMGLVAGFYSGVMV
jgi:hypothetical protein